MCLLPHRDKGFIKNEERCLKSLKRLRREINADAKDERHDTIMLLGKWFTFPLTTIYIKD